MPTLTDGEREILAEINADAAALAATPARCLHAVEVTERGQTTTEAGPFDTRPQAAAAAATISRARRGNAVVTWQGPRWTHTLDGAVVRVIEVVDIPDDGSYDNDGAQMTEEERPADEERQHDPHYTHTSRYISRLKWLAGFPEHIYAHEYAGWRIGVRMAHPSATEWGLSDDDARTIQTIVTHQMRRDRQAESPANSELHPY